MPSESGGNPERVPPLVAAGVLLRGFAATLPPGGARGVSLLTNALTLAIAAMILREALARVRRGREAGAVTLAAWATATAYALGAASVALAAARSLAQAAG